MKINSISQNYNKQYPSFNGITRIVYKEKIDRYKPREIKHRNSSFLFRPTLDQCVQTYSYLGQKFKDKSNVNVYNYGCSLGYEAYGFIMILNALGIKNPEKFFPIIAKDYDEEIIKATNYKKLPLDYYEINLMEILLGNKRKVGDYISLQYSRNKDPKVFGENANVYGYPSQKLKDNVEFSVGDIRDDYQNIEPDDTVVMATNFWPYMKKSERINLAENLYNQLNKESFVKIGSFDNSKIALESNVSTSQLLLNTGFQATPILNLFKK